MDAVFARGFGTGNLFTNGARLAYLQDLLARPADPAHGLRIDARANDLRGWTPRSPMLMCGGAQDATVSFATNTGGMDPVWEVARNCHAAAFPFCASAASRFFSLF